MSKSQDGAGPRPGAAKATEDAGARPVAHGFLARWSAWWRAKNPVLRLVVMMGLCMALFYGFALTPFFKNTFSPSCLRANATISSAILRGLGQQTTVSGTSILSPKFSVNVFFGCDAIEPTMLFLATLLAFPAPFARKVPGMVLGSLLLLTLNLVRIVSLYFIGAYFPGAFHVMHAEIWQIIFIGFAILLCVLAIRWAMKAPEPKPDAAGQDLRSEEKMKL